MQRIFLYHRKINNFIQQFKIIRGYIGFKLLYVWHYIFRNKDIKSAWHSYFSFMKFLWIILVITFSYSDLLSNSLMVAPIFSDNMVLQANKKITIWGKMQPQSIVVVTLGNKSKKTKVKDDGTWKVVFPKRRASNNPVVLEVSAEGSKISFNNIVFGELWLCIGQYNMLFPMEQEDYYYQEIKTADYPDIRFFTPLQITDKLGIKQEYPYSVKLALKEGRFYYKGSWVKTNKNTLPQYGAIAFYFAKNLQKNEGVPIGIINLAVEGSPIESWINEINLHENRRLAQKVNGVWMKNPYLPSWSKYIGTYNLYGLAEPPANPDFLDHPYKPGYLFQTGIEAIKNLAIRGILSYQGETNSDTQKRTVEYADLLKLLIRSYRQNWDDAKLPFYMVQLPSIDNSDYVNAIFWPEFRNQQWQVVTEFKKYVGIVPSYDLDAETTIPTNKKLIGERLCALALYQVYHKKTNLYPPAPYPIKAVFRKDGVLISFASTGSGLEVVGGDQLHGFSINGNDDSRASIYHNNKVLVETSRKPKYVYYAWNPNATYANLVNSAKIPAISFKLKVH